MKKTITIEKKLLSRKYVRAFILLLELKRLLEASSGILRHFQVNFYYSKNQFFFCCLHVMLSLGEKKTTFKRRGQRPAS